MNNGKVRIYELSKELNLENKDLLGICEDLSIVVKSHSSSISEAEAEQITNVANEKFPNRQNKAPRQTPPEKRGAASSGSQNRAAQNTAASSRTQDPNFADRTQNRYPD